ncbi:MAG: two-component system, OmpR family, sensor histidine kinase MprB [Chloroflexota bacterium]|jgi:two-component system sensor histidine kinase MprB|nr:two-component system, OmpR family, sensor histidine kinase MprB [Chloroflexota bacterium]
MSFRLRVTLLAAGAVAVAIVGAAVLMFLVVQQQLLGQVDKTLADAANTAQSQGPRGSDRGGRPPSGDPGQTVSGRGDVFAQSIDATGRVIRADYSQPVSALVTSQAKQVATTQQPSAPFDTTISGTHYRVLAVPLGGGTALELAFAMTDIDAVLAETRTRLILVALGGVLLAAALGTVVARAAIAPVKRLTSVVEEVARTRDLSRRVAATGNDELSRLAASFNEMLGALEVSLRQQRQLVADASHELRTPLTSLRTNLELLARGHPTEEAERHVVLTDLVAQMERLSTLVADLIDLARDEETSLPVEDVRLDEVVVDALAGVRGRYPTIVFAVASQPTTVSGVRSRVFRAVTNLLDNAGKWSPAGGTVEVSVADGEVSVRDHGPGVRPEDAPHVFDRFWRASSARHLPGSGLGLSIVKDVAEKHGGSVTLEPAPGGGARFRLRLAA